MSRSALPSSLPPLQRRETCPGISQTSQPLDINTSVSRMVSRIPEEAIRQLPHSSSSNNAGVCAGLAAAPPLAAPAGMQAEKDMPWWQGHH